MGQVRVRAGLVVALGAAFAAASLPARAIPRLDLKPYPAPAADELRWVIQLPGLLPPPGTPPFLRIQPTGGCS
ncbi:hypothetical protein [Cyanobium sp. ATX-6F1]|uniref:hypothetical protein n=1 Tax=Cyanobium sp. ATX-6F1 TaxID=3137388 RepID=UPI0039BDB91D